MPTAQHYLKPNEVTRVPRTFVYLDSEAHQHEEGPTKVQRFRLAVTACDRRYHHRDGWREREWGEHYDPAALWEWVDERCATKARTVIVAHNLAYDLRITDALRLLSRRGWRLERFRFDTGAAWVVWRNMSRTLVMADSMSWLPMSLERIGQLIGVPKLSLPAWDDSPDAWLARCRQDVLILANAYRQLVEWVRADDLGNWKPTGAGQSWAAFRHRFMDARFLVHDNDRARAAERRSTYTGRAEAWRHGKLPGGPFYEWDYSTAYARIGAECEIPIRLVGETGALSLARFDQLAARYSVLADVRVRTDVPTVPTRNGDRIVWPTGEFRSTLWENEIALARAHGAEVEIERAWWYYRDAALSGFCLWCLDLLDERSSSVSPIVRAAVKHWSRALIGRFASRWSDWSAYGRAPIDGVSLGWAQDTSSGERWRMLHLGPQLLRQTAERDSPDAVVSVMAWIMAEARCRLWRTAEVAGIEHVAYLDTDSLIVDPAGHRRLLRARLSGLRVKREYDTLQVLGPRQIVTQGELRAAGVPRGAVRIGPDLWQAEAWAQIGTSLVAGEADAVRISPRRLRLRGVDSRREHLPKGRTVPLALSLPA